MEVTEPRTLHLRVERPLTSPGDHLPWGGVDIDVHRDTDGLPEVRRSSLNARLGEVCLEFLPARMDLLDAAARLFGRAGTHDDTRVLSVRDARLPAEVRRAFHAKVIGREINPQEALEAFTAVTTTTAIDATGAPKQGSMRSVRAVRPNVVFVAQLHWLSPPTPEDLTCLAWAVLGLRQVGLGASRGRGLVTAALDGSRDHTLALAGLDTGAP